MVLFLKIEIRRADRIVWYYSKPEQEIRLPVSIGHNCNGTVDPPAKAY